MTTPGAATYQHVAEVEAATAGALLRWTLSLADTKHRIGLRTSEWVNGGPALEAAVGASAITQDELGHARSLYAMLKEFPDVPAGIGAENDLQARDDYFSPRSLDSSWPSWLDVIAANVLVDRATNIAVAAGRGSSFGPLKGRIAKILQEERFHRVFGDSWLAKLARASEAHHHNLGLSLSRFGEMAFAWLGPDDSQDSHLLSQAGILSLSSQEMRTQWLEEVSPLLEKYEFTPPKTEIDWSGWNSSYRDLGNQQAGSSL